MKNVLWKQPTPVMQLKAIIASMEGHKSNYEDKIISETKYVERIKEHIEQLIELSPFIEKGKWF